MIKALAFLPTQQCSAGEHFSESFGGCVLDDPGIIVDINPPATAPKDFMLYAGIGLALLLLLGAFAGGRSSGKRSSSSPKLFSRTTTRSIFG
jgi:hypothetical protein